MIPVLSKKETLALDKQTVLSNYLTELELIENSGRSIAQYIIEKQTNPFNKKYFVIIGPGNNGQDGVICHYYLRYYGLDSQLILMAEKQFSNSLIKKYNISNKTIKLYNKDFKIDPKNYYIDGLFGVGLNRDICGDYLDIINKMQNCKNVISIDIPSGILCDTGCDLGINIKAKYTLTMGYPKLGHFFNSGLDNSGDVHILDIGFKPLENQDNYIHLIEKKDIQRVIIRNKKSNHKYNRGKVLVIAGSFGYTGACILAVQGVMKIGAGIVKLLVSPELNTIYETMLTEAITIPILKNHSKCINETNINVVKKEIEWADDILFGPGLKIDQNSSEWMVEMLKNINKPLVLDASGFHPLIENRISLNDLPPETILTPHYSEFSHIFNVPLEDVINNTIDVIKNIISQLNKRVLILKGPTNIIVTSTGKIFLMDHGNANLATAGTGDVLSGIITGALAQGLSIDDAVLFSTYIHAECSHQYSRHTGNHYGFTAGDVVTMIPKAMDYIYDIS